MPAHRKHISKETLRHLYLEQGQSRRKIGLRLGCGETAVRKQLKGYNIPMRSRSQAIRLGKGIVIERETLVELYWGQDLSIPEVATRLDCSEDVVRSRMQEYDIPRRTPSESAQLSRGIDLPEELARKWYVEQQLSIAAIAEAYGCSAATVSRKMSKFGITARPPWRERYPRHNFSGDPLKKTYLIGFRLGDLTVHRAELSIEVLITTTRQEQVDLMHDLFDRYGHVYEHHRPDTRIFMQVRLNDSFSFLIPKEDRIPDWVLADEECFFALLAGYVKLPGAKRRGFLREEACASFARAGAAAPKSPALPFTPTASGCQPRSGWTFSGFSP